MTPVAQPTIFTIGHSNRTLAELTELLTAHEIELLVDVRAFPGSRRLPHFGQAALASAISEIPVGYLHLRDLGGRRKPSPEAAGSGDGWRNTSFRAYAEYAQSKVYRQALDELIAVATTSWTVIMCSEAVPWRCHRWLVADTLVARDIQVLHIMGPGQPRQHVMSPFATVDGPVVAWPGPPTAAALRLGPAISTEAAPR
jgi:uncharacterized protein (DUF488 family)